MSWILGWLDYKDYYVVGKWGGDSVLVLIYCSIIIIRIFICGDLGFDI